MKHLFVIMIISIAVLGCTSGNKPTESNSQTEESVVSDSNSAMESDPGENAEVGNNTSTDSVGKLESLRIGMKEEQVIELLGEPTSRETLGNDAKTKAEDWWYGDNQNVRIINGEVNFVVKDVARQKELMKQLMVAKRNKDEDAAKRIMDELTTGQK